MSIKIESVLFLTRMILLLSSLNLMVIEYALDAFKIVTVHVYENKPRSSPCEGNTRVLNFEVK